MNSIAQTNNSENPLSEKMQYFLQRYHVSRILRSAHAYKHGGFPVLSIFLAAFSTVFSHRSFLAAREENLPRKRQPRSCSVSCRKRRRRRFPHVMSCLTRGFALLHHSCPSMNLAMRSSRWRNLRKALGDRGVLHGVQELSASGEGLPCTLIRCNDRACIYCVFTVYVSGGGATGIQR